jgi:hypothetical protein
MNSGLLPSIGFETHKTPNASFLSHRCDMNVTFENESKVLRIDYDRSSENTSKQFLR